MKKNSLVWYGLAIFLTAVFNVTFALIQATVGLFDVVLFIFGILILMVSVLTRFYDE